MEPHELLFEDTETEKILTGLARQCPRCKCIAHYSLIGRKPKNVICVEYGYEFMVQKYKRGQRPKAKRIKKDG